MDLLDQDVNEMSNISSTSADGANTKKLVISLTRIDDASTKEPVISLLGDDEEDADKCHGKSPTKGEMSNTTEQVINLTLDDEVEANTKEPIITSAKDDEEENKWRKRSKTNVERRTSKGYDNNDAVVLKRSPFNLLKRSASVFSLSSDEEERRRPSKKHRSEPLLISSSDSDEEPAPSNDTSFRLNFCAREKKDVVSYVFQKKEFGKLKGTSFWKTMEKHKVVPGRTWQSLKNHFMRCSVKNLEKYNLPEKDLIKFRKQYEGKTFRRSAKKSIYFSQ